MRTTHNLLYLLGHKEFYESIDYYSPVLQDFFEPVKGMATEDWKTSRSGVWFTCFSPRVAFPLQGWKIHVSSTPKDARQVLDAVVPILIREDTGFKFALDRAMLGLLNGKSWSRGGGGKFITIYPRDDAQFKGKIEEVHLATKGFEGPHILSDRRYKDSRVVYYRYGGMKTNNTFDIEGETTPVLVSPDGQEIPDRRLPYFVLPAWISDPFRDESIKTRASTLKNDRYIVKKALAFSNSGGVYLAEDRETNRDVVIKEARPLVNWNTSAGDAVALLQKEYRILNEIADKRIAPLPLDFFREWEHYFLVEEYIEGISLRAHSAINNCVLLTRPTRTDIQDFYQQFVRIFRRLAEMVELIHATRIVFGDLSPDNFLILPESSELRIIDFEAAYEQGKDKPVPLFTPGFASAEQVSGRRPTFETDYYAVGALMLNYLAYINNVLGLKPSAKSDFVDSIISDMGLPKQIGVVIGSLMADDPLERPKPTEALSGLSANAPIREPGPSRDQDVEPCLYERMIEGINSYALQVASPQRNDRLFPADPKVFTTNPLSIAYGACGIAHAITRTGGTLPGEVVSWILNQPLGVSLYPPGLYTGLSGVAWVLLDLGFTERGCEIMELNSRHPLLYNCPDMFFGISGWGLTNLKFFVSTGNEIYLQRARDAGNQLLASRIEDEKGCCWESVDDVSFGFAHGSSGIALFLLYLFLATGYEVFLRIGREALNFDLNNAVETREGGISWTYKRGVESPVYPYWRYGSAGVGLTTLRYYRLLEDKKYKSILDRIYADTDRKYAVLPSKFLGLAGLGDFLMDMYQFTGQEAYLKSAFNTASGIALFAIKKGDGFAFPGDGLFRISCDYGTGGAGIALFLHRVITRRNGDFMLDELLMKESSTAQGSVNQR